MIRVADFKEKLEDWFRRFQSPWHPPTQSQHIELQDPRPQHGVGASDDPGQEGAVI